MADLEYSAGDIIHLRLAKEEIEGMALESSEGGLVLLKLKNGYNIGIAKENILGGKVVKKGTSEEKISEPLVRKEGLGSIGLVITGGTIASKLDPKTGGVKWLTNVGEFLKYYPEVQDIANISRIEVPFMVASESMNSEHWIKIAECVKGMLDDPEIEGVVVTHGTDSLGYTAAALSYYLKELNKPVVLTYSQRSIDRASSDANLNLRCAAKMALSEAAEVILVGHATGDDDYCFAMPGTKVRKMHSSRRDAFKVVNAEPLAKVWPDRIEFLQTYTKKDKKKKVELDTAFSDKIALVKFYPGQDPSILDFYALKYKGIIVEASGLGHLPVSESSTNWLPTLKKHIRNGFVVCVTTQCINGRVDGYVYSNGRELMDAGVIFLEDMLSETAYVKLGWILGHYGWKASVKDKMLEPIARDLNPRLEY